MPEDDDVLKSLARTIARIEELLERLPLDVAKDLRARIATLRTVMLEKRPPALVLVGRRGAGKSSLVNALLGAKVAELGHVLAQTGRGRWYDVERGGGVMSILDTRGLQEGSAPVESDEAKSALESIAVELRTKAPDLVVFVAKATEVDAAIDADLDAVEKVYEEVRRAHRLEPPLVCVVTHADLLEPKATRLQDAAR
jgi:predicted GTPase